MLLAARCKYGTQKSRQKSPSGHHHTTLSGYIFATTARIDNRKKLLSSNISSTCPHNMVNFGLLAAEILSLVWGTPPNFNGFRLLACSITARHSGIGRQPNSGVEQGAPPIFAITLGIGPHSSLGLRGLSRAYVAVYVSEGRWFEHGILVSKRLTERRRWSHVDGTLTEQVRHGLIMLSQRILGPNTIIQGAVKTILNSTPQRFIDSSIALVQVSLRTVD